MTDLRADGQLLIASNRGPVKFVRDADGALSASRGGGGVVSALSAAADELPLTWVCAALSDADREAASRATGGLLDLRGLADGTSVRMLDIPQEIFDSAYNWVANSTLWFVHHMLYDTPSQPSFGSAFAGQWEAFRRYNELFADAIAEAAAGPSPVRAAIQDYHLCLAPRLLAERVPGLPIVHFSHTPWAPPDYYRVLPDEVGQEILAGLLGADHVGFLCKRWADSFTSCCEVFLGAKLDAERGRISYRGHITTVGVHPLGVDAVQLRARAAEPDVIAKMTALADAAAGRKLIVRIDRTELSKNISRGLEAYRELLRAHPEWHGRVVHLAFAYPSRHDLPEYQEYTAAVQRLAGEIKAEFSTPGWNPLQLEVYDDYARSLAACRIADVLLVNPVRDGMNLVAKEGPILSDRNCALVLSNEAGAAAELGGHALMVNPFDVSQTMRALHRALTMSDAERASRCSALAAAASALPPARWLDQQLEALDRAPGN